MSEQQYEVEALEAEAGLQVEFLPAITPEVQAQAMTSADERYLAMYDALEELAIALDGYEDLQALVKEAKSLAAGQRRELVNATVMLGAFSEGLRTLKEQRNEQIRAFEALKLAIATGDQTHPAIREALSDAVEDGIELSGMSFLNDLQAGLMNWLGLSWMDAMWLAEALYGFPNQELYEDEELAWEEVAIPDEGKEHLLKLLEVIKQHREAGDR